MPEDRTTCRDFERGVCNRGENCRYYHPEDVTPTEGTKLPICKDFQNKECLRRSCKFLHITDTEEEEYNRTGALPEHGGRAQLAADGANSPRPHISNGQQVCKDFLNGVCNRGTRCKFSHAEEGGGMDAAMYGKRARFDGFYGGGVEGNRVAIMEENEMLRQKVTSLQKEVTDLRQMNDTMYEQNAKYRTHLGSAATSSHVNMYTSASVTYPHYTQTAYPTAGMPVAAAYNAYTY